MCEFLETKQKACSRSIEKRSLSLVQGQGWCPRWRPRHDDCNSSYKYLSLEEAGQVSVCVWLFINSKERTLTTEEVLHSTQINDDATSIANWRLYFLKASIV
jgi:hypothetical protein